MNPYSDIPLCAALPVLFTRPWGGQRLPELYASWLPDPPRDKPVGEAWLVSDHPECESILLPPSGPGLDPFSLRTWMEQAESWLLGIRAKPTPAGRFPLLLKLIHATAYLSVQVHPDDKVAKDLGEPDVGKTEMWTFLETAPESAVIAGIRSDAPREEVISRILHSDRRIEACLQVHRPKPWEGLLIPAGTLHAIGPGLLLAEIQQNSNITYRVYDWDRVDENGLARALHPEKSVASLIWDLPSPCLTAGEKIQQLGHGEIILLASCDYFCAERVVQATETDFSTNGDSFHLLLNPEAPITVMSGGYSLTVKAGQAVIIAAGSQRYRVMGATSFLRYYVP